MLSRRTLFGLIPAAAVAYVTTRAGSGVQEQMVDISLDFGRFTPGYVIDLSDQVKWVRDDRGIVIDLIPEPPRLIASRYFTKLESWVDFK